MNSTRPYPTVNTKSIEKLREEGPLPRSEISYSDRDRVYMRKIGPSEGGRGSGKTRPGHVTPIIYLVGDERRAVRKFIDENRDWVDSSMSDEVNPINTSVSDFIWEIFCQEYYWDNPSRIPSDFDYQPIRSSGISERDDGTKYAKRTVRDATGSLAVSIHPDIVEQAEMEGGEDLAVGYDEHGTIVYRPDGPFSAEVKLQKTENPTQYRLTIPVPIREVTPVEELTEVEITSEPGAILLEIDSQ